LLVNLIWVAFGASADTIGAYEGRRLFVSYCQLCHGPGGKGDGPLAVRMKLNPADLTTTVRSRSDTILKKIISGEGPQTITGRDRHNLVTESMPDWAGVFTENEIGALIAYLRFLSTSKHELMGDPEEGFRIYQKYCQVCHGEDGSGDGVMTELMGMEPMDHTNPVVMNRLSNDELILSILDGAGVFMPAWEGILSKSEVEALVSYIRLLAQ
jgi:cbb3-type cytochrome c oxidase subunit III